MMPTGYGSGNSGSCRTDWISYWITGIFPRINTP
jgi:hypothetical protein